MEGGQLQVVQRLHRPAVLPIGGHVFPDALLAPPYDLADRLPGSLIVGDIVTFAFLMVNQSGENLGEVSANRLPTRIRSSDGSSRGWRSAV